MPSFNIITIFSLTLLEISLNDIRKQVGTFGRSIQYAVVLVLLTNQSSSGVLPLGNFQQPDPVPI
jgi:hypothetical protein